MRRNTRENIKFTIERAHPENPAFQDSWSWRRRVRGLVPCPRLVRSPWKQGMINRYKFCQPYAVGKRVLDVPCGCGWGTSFLRRTRRLLGIDLSLEAIQYAQNHYSDRADFMIADMRHLPFAAESFDLVICLEGIEHIPVEIGKQFIQEAARVLSVGGRLILTNPLPDPKRSPNPYHVHEYELEELGELLEPEFKTELQKVRSVGGVSIVYYVGEVCKRSFYEDDE